ncbi:hypothetical protein PS2_018071 [Malus domestica]
MATTAVATTVTITCSEVHSTATMAQVVPSKAHDTKAMAQAMSLQAQRELNALPSRAQASHPCASHSEQLASTEQPTLVARELSSLLPLSSPLLRPSLLSPSSSLSRPNLLSPSSLLSWPNLLLRPSLLSWPSKWLESIQD